MDVVQGYMAMALKSGALSGSEAAAVVERTKAGGRHHKSTQEAVGSFTIDFGLALTDPDDAKAHSLAVRFDELALFDDITSGDFLPPVVDSV